VLQALGFVVGVALAPVTAGASLAIAAMAVLVVDATVDALLGNAERQAHGGLSKAAATGFGLPLDWTSIQLVPNAPVVLDLRPNDAAISTEGVFTWFELRPRLGTARLRAEDVSVQDIWPSTRLEPIVLLLEGAESLVHPEDSAVRIEWTLTVPGSSIPPRVTESTLCPARGPDHAAVRFSIDHQSAALRPFDHFVVSCRVYRPGETGTKELFQGKTAIRITDRLLREKPYVRWAHAAFFEGFTRRVGDPFRASKGTVRAERTSRIHLTDPALRCKMADRYSKHLLPTSLDYLAALPFPSSELVKHRSSVCEYCFFGGPTHPDPKPGV
jgi:hypothetical protein